MSAAEPVVEPVPADQSRAANVLAYPASPQPPRPPVAHARIELLEPEPRWKRSVYGILAFLLACGFLFAATSYWVPAHAGTDQNGYLVGGRMLAKTLTMRQSPVRPGTRDEFDPHQFIGRMWVGADEATPNERFYPKYPIGLPVLYAIMLWIGSLRGEDLGLHLSYWISPVCMAIAVFGTYLLGRRFAGSFGGLMSAIVFGTSPVTMNLATNPNSHASCVCFVVWGMYMLICWWEKRGIWRGLLAGFFLGYAMTIRYSEGTLLLPLGLVGLYALNWRSLKSWGESLALGAGWALPVGLLVIYNHFAIGATTGYDPTNESTGFAWSYAAENWETMFRHMNTNGLAQLFPLALGGMVWMFWWNWRAASVMAGWIVPCLLIYTFYYWAPDGTTIGYLRFFTTILPGLTICFFWLVSRLSAWAMRGAHTPPSETAAVPSRGVIRRFGPPTAVAVAGVVGLVVVGLALEHAWLWEHDPVSIGWQKTGRLVSLLTPKGATDLETGSPIEAMLSLRCAWLAALAAGAGAALIAIAVLYGKPAVPVVGAGFFAAVVVAIHLVNAVPWMEMDQLQRYQLLFKVDAIRTAAPEGSVVFCQEQAILNDLQFAGDYALYDGESFRADWVQRLPNQEAADQPQGLDPGRRMGLFARLKGFDQKALDERARTIMAGAIASNRRVFFVLPGKTVDSMPKRLRKMINLPNPGKEKPPKMPDLVNRLCTPDRFDTDVVSYWTDYVPRVPIQPTNGPRGMRMNKPMDPQVNKQPLQLIEVTRHVPTTTAVPPVK